jgi:hypothetical protein
MIRLGAGGQVRVLREVISRYPLGSMCMSRAGIVPSEVAMVLRRISALDHASRIFELWEIGWL